jgi:hypothetical protein
MPELGFDTRYHLIQLAKLDEKSPISRFAKVIHESNPILRDMPILPSNEILGYTGTRETSLPTPQIIKVGDGWDASKAEWDSFSEVISMFKDRIDVPRDVIRIQKNKAEKMRLIRSEHQEGFSQGVSNHLINGSSSADPEKFDGLGVRYNTPDASNELSPTNGDYGVYDGGGTGSATTSIWLLQWGEGKIHGLCPMNDQHKGLRIEDMGRQYYTAENSKSNICLRTELEWDLGLCVSDYRCCARIRNVYASVASMDITLWKTVVRARNNFKGSAPVWMYVSPNVFTQLDIMSMERNNVFYDKNNPWNKPLYRFRDMPIGKCDCISETETAVAAA